MAALINAMLDILRLVIVFLVMVFLIRMKMKVGYVLLICSAALGLLYLMRPADIWRSVSGMATSQITITLILALSFIRMMEMLLREHDVMARMMSAFRGAFGSRKAVIVSMPMLIGMLPSVGGAYFSAPMVDEATRDVEMPADEKAYINYWFRHPWEFILPLYPGILLASALSGAQLGRFILANLPQAALMLALGFAFSMRGLGSNGNARRKVGGADAASFIPVGAVLLLVMAFHVKLYIAIGGVVMAMVAYYRIGLRKALELIKYGFALEVIVLISGVMLFKETMEVSGAVDNISRFFIENHIPLMPTLIVLPFAVGVLTGITVGYVGATFPLLASLSGNASIEPMVLAFASGFVGVLVSPVHVCLVLTREYFRAEVSALYKRMYLPALALLLLAMARYLALI